MKTPDGGYRPTLLQRGLARLGRALDPDAERHREQLLEQLAEWRRQEAGATEREAGRLEAMESLLAALARDMAANKRQLTRVRGLFEKQRRLLSNVVRRSGIDQRWIEAEHRVEDRLARLSRSGLPVIVGPWTGEVGFELLYWIPFLQWIRETYPFNPSDFVVLSRGGVKPWYAHVASEYEDIFDYASVEEFHAATNDRKKQAEIRPFDRRLIRQVMRQRGMKRVHVIHPTLMYTMYNAFWRYAATVKHLETRARFRRLSPAALPAVASLELPERFFAVRFYFSDCFPDTPENRRFATQAVDRLATLGDVVLLNSDLVVDDHRDFAPSPGSRVHVLAPHMDPSTNLAVQTAVISRASAFVGTYGGYSYLAPLYGVPSLAFYSKATFKPHHLELAHRAFHRLGTARLMPFDVQQSAGLRDALARVVAVSAGEPTW